MSSQPAGTSPPAVFLSYAREDASAARRIAEALRAAGIAVWFDENELRGGDAWDRAIRRQIKECALFLPVISKHTHARQEGYFRLEWHLAEQRSLLIAKGRPFIVPVTLGGTPESDALVPDAFLAVQWTRLPEGSTPALTALVERVQTLLGISQTRPAIDQGPEPRRAAATPAIGSATPRVPDYELLRIIGRGSYGDVWLARGVTGIYRAIKIVWRDRFDDAAPFEREFKGLTEFAAISLGESIHMALLHVGRNDEAGYFYYVMELADDAERGRDIDPDRYVPLTLTEIRARQRRISAGDCVTYGVELARVLAALHRRGLVHRDIKPSNVILVGGVPKLADIGLVASATAARTFVGTEGFVPPEGPGSPAADVYALGKVLYELATGLDRQAFPQWPVEVQALPDRRVLFELNEVILLACDPAPARRYADAAALLVDLESLRAGHSLRARRRWRGVLSRVAVVGLVAAMAIIGVKLWPKWHGDDATAKTIAVLPFENTSEDRDANAFFADGVHEDILTGLTHIPALHVTSRTSVMQYRGTTKTIRQIGGELGVRYVLEGRVQRSGKKVRVTAQLIDAKSDQHVWAGNYDRDLDDIFAIQSALAREIAIALSAAISPATRSILDRRPTGNIAAYEQYLKGRAALGQLRGAQSAAEAEKLFQAALDLDPQFAAAWGQLAVAHAQQYFYDGDHTPARLAKADAAIARARALAPDAPEVLTADGLHAYYGYRDFARAVAQFERLRHQQPFDPTIHTYLGAFLRRQGKWKESLASFQEALRLDPTNWTTSQAVIQSLREAKRWSEALAEARRIGALHGMTLADRADIADAEFAATGLLAEADAVKREMGPPGPGQPSLNWRLFDAVHRDDWVEFTRLTKLSRAKVKPTDPGSAYTACVFFAIGDTAYAKEVLNGDVTVADLRAQLEKQPANARLWRDLGLAEALRGNKAEALRCADHAVALMPESLDGYDGPQHAKWRAWTYAWAGETDTAIRELTRLVRTPGAFLNVRDMQHDPVYYPLRKDSRFQAMLADPKNDAPLF